MRQKLIHHHQKYKMDPETHLIVPSSYPPPTRSITKPSKANTKGEIVVINTQMMLYFKSYKYSNEAFFG